MSEPFTLDGADDDLIADLCAVGLANDQALPDEQEALDAAASQTMRIIRALDADLNRYTMAEDAETALIHARYRVLMESIERQRGQLAAVVERIAAQSEYAGKAKSRKTPYGTFGVRKLPERFEIVDAAALLAWAKVNAPGIVTETEPKERVLQKDAANLFALDKMIAEAMPLAGVRIVPEVPAAPFFKLTEK